MVQVLPARRSGPQQPLKWSLNNAPNGRTDPNRLGKSDNRGVPTRTTRSSLSSWAARRGLLPSSPQAPGSATLPQSEGGRRLCRIAFRFGCSAAAAKAFGQKPLLLSAQGFHPDSVSATVVSFFFLSSRQNHSELPPLGRVDETPRPPSSPPPPFCCKPSATGPGNVTPCRIVIQAGNIRPDGSRHHARCVPPQTNYQQHLPR